MTEAVGTADIIRDLDLPPDFALKWARVAAIKAIMRGRWTIDQLAQATMTEPERLQDWLRGRVRDVPVSELVYIYDIAAKAANAPTIAEVVRGYVQILGERK